VSDAFRCDGCDEFFETSEQALDVSLQASAAHRGDTFDAIKDTLGTDRKGTHGDFCAECADRVLEALADLFLDDRHDVDDNISEESDETTTDTDEDVEVAVEEHNELPEFEELLEESGDDAGGGDQEASSGESIDKSLPPTAEELVTVLRDHGELPSAELKDITERSSPAILSNLSDLEAMGRVESRKDPDDGRRQLYSLVNNGDSEDEHRVGDPIDEDSAGATETEADGGVTTDSGSDLPLGLTAEDVRDAVDAVEGQQAGYHAYLDDVADELNVRRTRARVFTVEVGVYDRVTDASGPKGDDD